MRQIENNQQDGRFKLSRINNHIKYKWSKCSNEKVGFVRLDEKARPRLAIHCPKEILFKYKGTNKLKVKKNKKR